MAGRPPLRIGGHGKITRTQLGGDRWVARCRYRGDDGKVRVIERQTPADAKDRHGAAAESALLGALAGLQSASGTDITPDSLVRDLQAVYMRHLEDEGREIRTLDTYRYASVGLLTALGDVRVRELTPQRIDRAIRAIAKKHGTVRARQCRTILNGMAGIAVTAGAVTINPVLSVPAIRSSEPPKSPRALTLAEVRHILVQMRTSTAPVDPAPSRNPPAKRYRPRTVAEFCRDLDLVDVMVMLAATGLRRSEVLGLRWADLDLGNGTASVTGRLVRAKGVGVIREDGAKSRAGRRTIPLPAFAVEMLQERKNGPRGSYEAVFPSSKGGWRDPDNFDTQWSRVRGPLGFGWVSSHVFRKTVATILDQSGMTARQAADLLGHRRVSMTQDVYFGRGSVDQTIAEALHSAINSE